MNPAINALMLRLHLFGSFGGNEGKTFTDAAAALGALAALVPYAQHHAHCKKVSAMPTVIGRTYTSPTDWDNWRDSQVCDCGRDVALLRVEVI